MAAHDKSVAGACEVMLCLRVLTQYEFKYLLFVHAMFEDIDLYVRDYSSDLYMDIRSGMWLFLWSVCTFNLYVYVIVCMWNYEVVHVERTYDVDDVIGGQVVWGCAVKRLKIKLLKWTFFVMLSCCFLW